MQALSIDDRTIDVWQLPYRREQRREPLLAVLARYLALPAGNVALAPGEHGRPQLAPEHASDLDFNWSHSGEIAVIALGRGLRLGIDVERVRFDRDEMAIAKRYFHPAETAYLRTLAGAAQTAAFFRLWTAKEALLKATGKGIVFGLERLWVELARESGFALKYFEGEQPGAWQLHGWQQPPGHALALAWRGTTRTIRWREA